MPRFAVAIPLHNKQAEIGEALDSVLGQTCEPAEVIVVDDASTDGGPALVRAHYDRDVRLLRRSVPGGGGYAARNMAIEHSTAEWIAFLDADDVWDTDHLEALARLALEFPSAGCVATRYTHVFSNRREADRVAGRFAGAEACLIAFEEFLRGWLETTHCPLWTGALAIRRDVLLSSGLFPAGQAERGGDKDLWLRVARHTEIGFLPRSTANFRRESSNKLTNNVDTRRTPCLVSTARAMARTAEPSVKRLLNRLINQEIMLYARWTAATGGRSKVRLSDLAAPPSLKEVATVVAAQYLPGGWLRAAYAAEQRRRDARRARMGGH